MSSSIDQRIVQMKFDNSQFENGVKTSLSTLDKLKNSLNLGKSAESLERLKNSTKGFSVASISDGLNELSLKFNALGVIGATVISNITTAIQNKLGNAIKSVLGTISSKGMRRALNLEQANFSMEGLLGNAEDVARVMGPNGPVQAAVDGTAYGLDAAALAASNLLAAGMSIDDLGKPLKTISGLAAQTGRSYEEMSDVIIDAYAKNKVQGYELQRLSQRGINAVAELQKYYKEQGFEYTIDDIQDLAREGEISANDLTNALFHFYDNAARANETYTGSLSNLQAALSRLGAKFASPHLKNMTGIFNSLRLLVNSINKALDPFISKWNDLYASFTKFAILKIDNLKNFIDNIDTKIIENAANSFGNLTSSIEKLWTNGKTHDLRTQIEDLNNGLSKIERLKLKQQLEEQALSPLDKLGKAFSTFNKAGFNIANTIVNMISPAFNELLKFIPKIGVDNILQLSKSFKNLSDRFSAFSKTSAAIIGIETPLKTFVNLIGNMFLLISEGARGFLKTLQPIINIGGKFAYVLSVIGTSFIQFVSGIINVIRENNILYLSFKLISDLIAGIFGPIIDSLFNKFNKIDSVLNINKKLESLGVSISSVISRFAEFLSKERDFSFIGKGILQGAQNISTGFASLLKYLSPLKDKFIDLKDGIAGFISEIDIKSLGVFEGFTEKLSNLWLIVTKIASSIGSGLSKIGTAISDTFDPKRVTGLASLGVLVANGGVLYLFMNAIKGLKSTVSDLGGIKGTIQSFIDGFSDLKNQLLGIEEDLDPAGLKNVAIAIAILAGSLVVLSMVDPSKMTLSTVAIGALMMELVSAIKLLDGITSDLKQAAAIKKMSTALIVLSGAILIISVAFKKLADLEWDQLSKGMVSIGALLMMLVAYSQAMTNIGKKEGEMVKAGGTLIALSLAINILATAVKKLGSIDATTLVNGLLSIGMLLLTLGLFTKYAEADKMSLSAGLGILALSAAVMVLATAVKKFGEIDPGTVAKGLSFMALALMEVIFTIDMIDGKKVLSSAIGVTIISAGLIVLGIAIQKLGSIPLVELTNGLVAMAVALGAIVLAVNLMPATSILSAAAIVAISAGILVLAGALKVLSSIPFEAIMLSIVGVAGILITFGLATSIMAPVIPLMIALSAAVALLGAGLAAVAIAIAVVTPVLVAFATALVGSAEIILSGIVTMGDQLVQAIIVIIESIMLSITETTPLIFETIALLLDGLLTLIIEYTPKAVEAVGVIIEALLKLVEELIPRFLVTVGILLDALLNFIVTYVPKMVDAGLKLIQGILQGIADNIQGIVEAAIEIVLNFINGISAKIPDIIQCGVDLLLSFIEGITQAINENSERIGTAAWELAEALVNGVIDGLAAFVAQPIEKIKQFGEDLLGGIKDVLGINSPSKEMEDIAKNTIEGFQNGLEENESGPVNTIGTFANNILKELKGKLSEKQSKSTGQSTVKGVTAGINAEKKNADKATNTIVTDTIKTLKSGLDSDKTKQYGANSVAGISSGIASKKSDAITKMTDVSTGVKNNANTNFAATNFTKYGANSVSGISSGIASKKSDAITKMTDVSTGVKNRANTSFASNNFNKYGANITSGIKNGMNNTVPVSRMGEIATNIKTKASNNLKSNSFNTYGANITSGLKSGMQNSVPVNRMGEIATNVKDKAAKNMPRSAFNSMGYYAMLGIKSGLNSMTSDLYTRAAQIAYKIRDTIKSALKISSPSKVMEEIGQFIILGLDEGLSEYEAPIKTVKSLTSSLTKELAEGIETDHSPTITPVLDLSEIQNGVSDINGMFGNRSIGSVAANFNGTLTNATLTSAFDKLSALINNMPEQIVDPNRIYDAVREGASHAVFNVILDGNRLTSVVNENMAMQMATDISFLGG